MKNENKNEEAPNKKNDSDPIVKSIQEIMKKNSIQTMPEEEPELTLAESWGAKNTKK